MARKKERSVKYCDICGATSISTRKVGEVYLCKKCSDNLDELHERDKKQAGVKHGGK